MVGLAQASSSPHPIQYANATHLGIPSTGNTATISLGQSVKDGVGRDSLRGRVSDGTLGSRDGEGGVDHAAEERGDDDERELHGVEDCDRV